MNRKIELAKKRRTDEASKRKLIKKQITSQESLKEAVDGLNELLNGKEEYDFDKLHNQLVEIDKRLDLAPLFKSLEKSIKDISRPTSDKTKIEGLSKLLKAVETLRDNPPRVKITTKADISQEYKASDADITTSPSYFGFIHPTGKWYIMRQSGTNLAMFRYSSGTSNYRKSWDSRASLDYGLYSEVKL